MSKSNSNKGIFMHLRGELFQGGSLNSVDGKLVSRVNGSESARDFRVLESVHMSHMETNYDVPNHFFEALPDSITSTTPGRSGSIDGTWLARIPMLPVLAAMFTWETSVDL